MSDLCGLRVKTSTAVIYSRELPLLFDGFSQIICCNIYILNFFNFKGQRRRICRDENVDTDTVFCVGHDAKSFPCSGMSSGKAAHGCAGAQSFVL